MTRRRSAPAWASGSRVRASTPGWLSTSARQRVIRLTVTAMRPPSSGWCVPLLAHLHRSREDGQVLAGRPHQLHLQRKRLRIDGNDHLLAGGLANPNHPIPGISTRNDTNSHEAIDSLDSGQRDNVTGLGFIAGPSPVPSILTSPAAPSTDQANQFANDLISRPGVVVTPMTQV